MRESDREKGIATMRAKEIMTRRVECVTPESTVRDAAQLMQVSDIGFLPVCETETLIRRHHRS